MYGTHLDVLNCGKYFDLLLHASSLCKYVAEPKITIYVHHRDVLSPDDEVFRGKGGNRSREIAEKRTKSKISYQAG